MWEEKINIYPASTICQPFLHVVYFNLDSCEVEEAGPPQRMIMFQALQKICEQNFNPGRPDTKVHVLFALKIEVIGEKAQSLFYSQES